MPDRSIDSIYYRDAGSISVARRISTYGRQNVYKSLIRIAAPDASTRILDIGVSDEEGPEANMLEQLYPWPGSITAAGLGEGREFQQKYPDCGYARIEADRPLPFKDKTFDIVWSNAVLEHVGGPEQRRRFLLEAARVARRVILAVPNRWFPVEHHTALPLVHWNAGLFRRMLSGTPRDHWAHQANLDFLSMGLLRTEWPLAKPPGIAYAGLWLGPFSSNLIIDSGEL